MKMKMKEKLMKMVGFNFDIRLCQIFTLNHGGLGNPINGNSWRKDKIMNLPPSDDWYVKYILHTPIGKPDNYRIKLFKNFLIENKGKKYLNPLSGLVLKGDKSKYIYFEWMKEILIS